MGDPYVSVIIPSHNSQKNLSRCLSSIKGQGSDVEVIVVDSSAHEKVRKICEQYPFVHFKKLGNKTNPGITRNRGAEVAKGKVLLFVDSDLLIAPNTILEVKRAHENGILVIGGAIELEKKVDCNFASYVEHYFFNHNIHRNQPRGIRKNLSSALLAVDTSLFRRYQGFRDIPRMQDTEFTERLANAGEELIFVPEVTGRQIQDSSLKSVLRKIYIVGNNRFFVMHPD